LKSKKIKIVGAVCDLSAQPNLTNFGKKNRNSSHGLWVFFLFDTHALAFFSPIFLATVGVVYQIIPTFILILSYNFLGLYLPVAWEHQGPEVLVEPGQVDLV
jgi:hypothetical protein